MAKTILITGASDGIGRLTAQMLAQAGHRVLLHGRNAEKLNAVAADIGAEGGPYVADLSDMTAVERLAADVLADHPRLDVLISNAGILKAAQPRLADGMDIRFMVNALAPYVLTKRLLPIIPKEGRVINLSSAAQARVDIAALRGGPQRLDDMAAYAQSKLAITLWSREMARGLPDGPSIIAINPGSLLASKMVREGFGIAGNDLSIGADILCRAALDAAFAEASGRYFDNDAGDFGPPNAAADDLDQIREVMAALEALS